ncbi:MAG: PEP-CTERM sorting domain-containing protein [Betaproteobacteria bacterium]|nr:PEP-CTERM sorting domain-containing protein [Betaproteobacteria bacterium]
MHLFTLAPVPEPATFALVGLGLVSLVTLSRSKRRTGSARHHASAGSAH